MQVAEKKKEFNFLVRWGWDGFSSFMNLRCLCDAFCAALSHAGEETRHDHLATHSIRGRNARWQETDARCTVKRMHLAVMRRGLKRMPSVMPWFANALSTTSNMMTPESPPLVIYIQSSESPASRLKVCFKLGFSWNVLIWRERCVCYDERVSHRSCMVRRFTIIAI